LAAGNLIARRRDGGGQNVIPATTYSPNAGTDAVIASAHAVYRALGAEDAVMAVAAEGPHRFYPEIAWTIRSSARTVALADRLLISKTKPPPSGPHEEASPQRRGLGHPDLALAA
jgi:hypothetical protein